MISWLLYREYNILKEDRSVNFDVVEGNYEVVSEFLKESMCIVVAIAIIMSEILIQIFDTTQITQYSMVIQIREIVTILVFFGMALFSLKSRMYFPMYLRESSQLYNLGELLI